MLAVFSDGGYSRECRVEVDDQGVEWLHSTHVCEILEMKNPTQTVQRHVDPDFRRQISWGDRGMPAWYLNEAGVYQLIFASKSARAKAFQRWVFADVLPSIRKGESVHPEIIRSSASDPFLVWMQDAIQMGLISKPLNGSELIALKHQYENPKLATSTLPPAQQLPQQKRCKSSEDKIKTTPAWLSNVKAVAESLDVVTVAAVLQRLKVPDSKANQMMISNILKASGYRRRLMRVHGTPSRVWVSP